MVGLRGLVQFNEF